MYVTHVLPSRVLNRFQVPTALHPAMVDEAMPAKPPARQTGMCLLLSLQEMTEASR